MIAIGSARHIRIAPCPASGCRNRPWSCCRRARPARNFRPASAARTDRSSPGRPAPSDWRRKSRKYWRGHCGSDRESPDLAALALCRWSSDALSCALICMPPSRALGAGFGTGTACEKAAVAEACAGCGDQQRQSVTQPAVGVSLCHQVFRISVQRVVPLAAILSRFRPKEISFFRENNASRPDFGGRISKSALFFLDQNFAFAGVICLPDDAFEFHPLHQ